MPPAPLRLLELVGVLRRGDGQLPGRLHPKIRPTHIDGGARDEEPAAVDSFIWDDAYTHSGFGSERASHGPRTW